MAKEMFDLMIMIALLIISGFILKKKNIITDVGKKTLTDILLCVILPCNILRAFCIETGEKFWKAFSTMLLVAVLVQILSLFVARFMYFRMKEGEKQVFQYGTVCSNAGFIGNPLTQSVFGDLGLLYASIYLIPLRIVMWTAGVSYFSNQADKKQQMKKVLLNPCMIAVYIGMVLLLTQWTLPDAVMSTVTAFSNCCTAMTMMYIGTILANVDFKSLISVSQLFFALLRLILLPGVVLLCCMLFKVDGLVAAVAVFLTAMPAGSTTSLLASKYGADEDAAAKCVVFTTLLSVVTLAVWSFLLKYLYRL